MKSADSVIYVVKGKHTEFEFLKWVNMTSDKLQNKFGQFAALEHSGVC